MRYRIAVLPRAEKEIAALDRAVLVRVDARINALAVNPRPPDCRKMAGAADLWRIRVGDWRVIYGIRDRELVVLVVKVGHRGDVYRR